MPRIWQIISRGVLHAIKDLTQRCFVEHRTSEWKLGNMFKVHWKKLLHELRECVCTFYWNVLFIKHTARIAFHINCIFAGERERGKNSKKACVKIAPVHLDEIPKVCTWEQHSECVWRHGQWCGKLSLSLKKTELWCQSPTVCLSLAHIYFLCACIEYVLFPMLKADNWTWLRWNEGKTRTYLFSVADITIRNKEQHTAWI